MIEGWIKIYENNNPIKVEIIKQKLIENNIVAIDINNKDSSYHFGTISLYVMDKDLEKSKKLTTIE